MNYTEMTACRGCGAKTFNPVIDLGSQWIVDFVKSKDEAQRGTAPLELVKCDLCNLVQLRHTVSSDVLFKKFFYRSGINESMRWALRDIVRWALPLVSPLPGSRVLDIGCNDGELLSHYPLSIRTVGIDPAQELVNEALDNKRMAHGVVGYFSADAVREHAPFMIITAIAMFYDLEDPVKFLKQCKEVLDDKGILIIQMNYLKTMLENCALDNVCHEHLTYFSLNTFLPLAERAGLEVLGVQETDTNGGSIRIYLQHFNSQLNTVLGSDKLSQLWAKSLACRADEYQIMLDKDYPYTKFKERAEKVREAIRNQVKYMAKRGMKIYLYGASTRGSTLMQYLGIEEYIKGAAERDEKKFGLKMVGTWVPIVSEEEARKDADIFLLLPYHFWESIRNRESNWLYDGGEFLVPLPEPRMVSSLGEYKLSEKGVLA